MTRSKFRNEYAKILNVENQDVKSQRNLPKLNFDNIQKCTSCNSQAKVASYVNHISYLRFLKDVDVLQLSSFIIEKAKGIWIPYIATIQ